MGTDASSTKRKRGLVVNADMATLIKTIEIGYTDEYLQQTCEDNERTSDHTPQEGAQSTM